MFCLLFALICQDILRTETFYSVPLLPEGPYSSDITNPEKILGFPIGERTATPEQIEQMLQIWARESDRVQRQIYAHSYEGRPLSVMIISHPDHLAKLEAYRTQVQKLQDPRNLDDREAEAVMMSLPAMAWLAYSIHGNESSGSDAAIALLYTMLASENPEITSLLQQMIIFVDPMMNPDGRARFCKDVEEGRGKSPNFDTQSFTHTGDWPSGRTNHYYFDLNRDFTLGINPETRGRVRLINQWAPQLFVDAHEMGSLDTYLFSPARQPINLHLAPFHSQWGNRFAEDQAKSFDQKGWRYYTGEWNDNWYPGYSFWCAYRGSLTILYEQARLAEDGVIRPEGTIMTYRESVHHQLTSSLVNLNTLLQHHHEIRRDYWQDKKFVMSPKSPYADVTYAFPPTANQSRRDRFLSLMQLHEFELYELAEDWNVNQALDQLGITHARLTLPKGTVLIPQQQPNARLLATMLEFDPRIPNATLAKERSEILSKGRSVMYDTTGWSASMLHDLVCYRLPTDLPDKSIKFATAPRPVKAITLHEDDLGFVWDGADDQSVALAARLMEKGYRLRTASKAFEFHDQAFSRGSVLLLAVDQTQSLTSMLETLRQVSEDLGLAPQTITTGLGAGDLPDLGGQHFELLQRPQIALMGRGSVSSYDFGSIWHVIDNHLGITHSLLDIDSGFADLRRYNVIVLPEMLGQLDDQRLKAMKQWVQEGGTLIAIGNSAALLAQEKLEFSKVRLLPDVLDKLDSYELEILKQWEAKSVSITESDVWSHVPPGQSTFPWSNLPKRADKEELSRQDAWRAQFMPQGAIFATRVQEDHWLTFGARSVLPVMFAKGPVLMTNDEAPVRFGVYESRPENQGKDRIGWAVQPRGYDLRLRMSGLVWPEAADRLAHAAYLTRESYGRGQIILFAGSPAFRGTTFGTIRLLTNALVYGPGLGTQTVNDLNVALP